MEIASGCLVCSKELIYLNESILQDCVFCRHKFQSNAQCASGHFICDACHGKDAYELIFNYCLSAKQPGPGELCEELMRISAVNMHGPEHHFLVPAVLLTIYKKHGNDERSLKSMLEEALKRSKQIPGGFCGTHGNCGACVGTGLAVSIILQSNPLAGEPWSASNRITGECLIEVANYGGPRCCKRDSFLALNLGTQFLNKRFGFSINTPVIDQCQFSDQNRQCILEACPFFYN